MNDQTIQEYLPAFMILGLMVLIVAGAWWALRSPRPPRLRKCPKCRATDIKRTGWGEVERIRTPWYARRSRFHFGLRIDQQKIYYRCQICDYRWHEVEGVPTIG